MQLLGIKTLGWVVAHAPEPLLRAFAAFLGDVIFFLLPRRHRLVLSNLHHAFPEKPAAWHGAIGRESCRRLIETGLLSLATPFIPERRASTIITASPELITAVTTHHAEAAPTLICSPHLAYWEAQTWMSLVVPAPFPEFGTIFRPLDNPAADEFVKASRERFGIRLLSRKEGFAEALKILRRKGFVGVLFDQNAGMQGALTTLFSRVCSTTELPGLMAEKFDARVYGIFPRRRGFWRVEVSVQRISSDGTSNGVTIALNRWLEDLLRSDDNLCASWLWAHDRWRNQDMPPRRFRLEAKRNLLAAEFAARRLAQPPRRTRIWIRLPNWLGDVVMALPLLRALRIGRPDAEITVVARAAFLPLLEMCNVADRLQALPPRGPGYFAHFRKMRAEYPDVWVLLTNSFRGDLEAWLAGAPQRFGIVRPGKPRPLLSHVYRLPRDFDEGERHQLELWQNLFQHFGLVAPLDRTSLADRSAKPLPSPAPIGLICGSENTPEKRWPVAHWRTLIESLPDDSFVLFGTALDAGITAQVAAGFPPERVHDRAGRTDLPAYVRELQNCRVLVTNDTGGLHLANALGVPLVALFGPTNPIRTGPAFDSPAVILQPTGCPPTGGRRLADLSPTTVAKAVQNLPAGGGDKPANNTIVTGNSQLAPHSQP
ncbi:MAG: glycosyltransferase family 9 protein [Opitutaceae bacterium]|nr:glycosyltransferase family 9 protein [Opitutaceae bacterium]